MSTAGGAALGAVWVVLPTYQEAENVEAMLAAVLGVFDRTGMDGHVLVVDDGSPDGTADLAAAVATRDGRVEVLRRAAKEGIGPAYRAGFRHALDRGADRVVEMDCDFSHDPKDVHRLVAASRDADLVIGSRNVPGGGVEGWPWLRNFISKGGSAYARTILGLRIRDMTAGFTLFRRTVLETLDLSGIEASGYMFQIELKYRTVQAGFSVHEVPVTFIDREFGESKMTGSIVTEAMWRVWRLRFRRVPTA